MSLLPFFFCKEATYMGKYVRKKVLAYAKTHKFTWAHKSLIEGPDTAKRLTTVLKVKVRNARSSPENILKFST